MHRLGALFSEIRMAGRRAWIVRSPTAPTRAAGQLVEHSELAEIADRYQVWRLRGETDGNFLFRARLSATQLIIAAEDDLLLLDEIDRKLQQPPTE